MSIKDYILGILCFLILFTGIIYATKLNNELLNSKEILLIEAYEANSSYIKVNVIGAVNTPGIKAVNKNNLRLISAINAAGGLHKNANFSAIEPAQSINNAIIISIPFYFEDKVVIIKKEKPKKKKTKAKKSSKKHHKKKKHKKSKKHKKKKSKKNISLKLKSINPNTASKAQLISLPGIGEKTADKIIEHRKNNRFNSPKDLKKVKGIGKKKLEAIYPYLTFN
ncbi:MAG: DUF655 domain-containing protein [Vampirovibrionia bacterium]